MIKDWAAKRLRETLNTHEDPTGAQHRGHCCSCPLGQIVLQDLIITRRPVDDLGAPHNLITCSCGRSLDIFYSSLFEQVALATLSYQRQYFSTAMISALIIIGLTSLYASTALAQ